MAPRRAWAGWFRDGSVSLCALATAALAACTVAAADEPASPLNPASLIGHGGPVKAIEIAPGGRTALTGSFDYSMIHWDLGGESPRLLNRFAVHDGAVNAVRLLPGAARALSAGDDGVLRLWNLDSGELVHAFAGHTTRIADLAVSADGRLAASAGWDRTVRLWDLETLTAGPVLDDHGGPVSAVAFASGEGAALYSAGADGTVRQWDADSGALARVVYRHGWGINALQVLPAGERLLFAALDGTAGVIDATTGDMQALAEHDGPVLALAVSREHGLAATGGADGAIRVWSIDTWRLREEYDNPYGPIWALAFSADGRRIYHGGLDDFAAMWQIRPRQPFEEPEGTFPRRFQVGDDLSLGERQFARKCSICHTLRPDGANRAGPTLHGVFGRRAGSLPGYPYSEALRNSDIVWSEATIGDLFRLGPEHVTPGTKMPLQRMTDARERNAMIAYMKSATEPGTDRPPAPLPREQ